MRRLLLHTLSLLPRGHPLERKLFVPITNNSEKAAPIKVLSCPVWCGRRWLKRNPGGRTNLIRYLISTPGVDYVRW